MPFQMFDSAEEMFAALEAANRALDAQVEPWQEALKPGDYVMRWDEDSELVIYAQILDPGEPDPSREYSPEELAEIREDGERYKLPEMRYRRFGRFWSVADPYTSDSGELGTSHVALFDMQITAEAFAVARELQWPNDPTGKVLAFACAERRLPSIMIAARS